MSNPLIRPASRVDFERFYGEPAPQTIRAIVGDLDGEIIAIGGIAKHSAGGYTIFSDIRPEARKFPIAMVKAAKQIVEMARGLPGAAVPWVDEAGAPRFLEYLGFVPGPNGSYILGRE